VAGDSVIERAGTQKPTPLRKPGLIAIGVLLSAMVFGRVLVQRDPAHESDTQVRSVDSRQSVEAARDTAFHVGTPQRTQ
jgi:hypothetical protein